MKVNSQCGKNDKKFSMNKEGKRLLGSSQGSWVREVTGLEAWTFANWEDNPTQLVHGAPSPGTDMKG